jgi:ribonuclease HI
MYNQKPITDIFFKRTAKIYPMIRSTFKKDKEQIYLLKFDGCSRGNPGLSGAGAVIYCNAQEIWVGSQYVGKKETNHYAEYCGLIFGLQNAVDLDIDVLTVQGDSQIVIKQMMGEYNVKSTSLLSLYTEAKQLEKHFEKITYEHIYRKFNSRADELANLAIPTDIIENIEGL